MKVKELPYHIEYIPLYSPRLPLEKTSTQHPESDNYFMSLVAAMEACEDLQGGCDNCTLKGECLQIQDTLSDQGSDKHIKASALLKLLTRFVFLREGIEK